MMLEDGLDGESHDRYEEGYEGIHGQRTSQIFRTEELSFVLNTLDETPEALSLSSALAAWALVLRWLDGIDSISFTITDHCVCKVDISTASTVREIAKVLGERYAQPEGWLNDEDNASSLDRWPSEHSVLRTELLVRVRGKQKDRAPRRAHSLPALAPDLRLTLSTTTEPWDCSLAYRPSQMDESRASLVVRVYQQAIAKILRNPEQSVGAFSLCDPVTRTQLQRWSGSSPELLPMCVHDLIARQAHIDPEAPAIDSTTSSLSRGRLDDLSSRLAFHLQSLGVRPGELIPLCVEKSAWAIVAMLGILKAGGAFVPFDVNQSRDRVDAILEQLDPRFMLLSSGKPLALREGKTVEVSEGMMNMLLDQSPAAHRTPISPNDPCYIIYTSGSTGAPKGVVMQHQAASISMMGQGPRAQMSSTTRALQFSSFSFDVSLLEILTTLVHGGCVCVPTEHERVERLPETMEALRVNWACLTNSVAAWLEPPLVPTLQTLLCAGEKVTKSVQRKWMPCVQFYNAYGPTEACILCCMRPAPLEEGNPSNIGRSLNCRTWVVHVYDHNCLLAPGAVGELLVEGPILAAEYLGDSIKTSKCFIFDPVWASDEDNQMPNARRRFYKTGDLVRYEPDGSLVILGRKDRQVKLNGQRVELGGIEAQLGKAITRASEKPTEVVVEVVAPLECPERQALVGFVVTELLDRHGEDTFDDDGIIQALPQQKWDEMKAILRESLPEIMLPSLMTIMKRIPTTTSGKVDRATLRAAATRLLSSQLCQLRQTTQLRQPVTLEEKRMQFLWSQALGISPDGIGADDAFTDHHGNSLVAMRLVSAASKQGWVLSFKDIFDSPRLSDMASILRVAASASPGEKVVEPFTLLEAHFGKSALTKALVQCNARLEDVEDVYMATSAQNEGLRAHIADKRVWVGKYAFQLPLEHDIARFCAAWQDTVAEMPILRTRIVDTGTSQALQVVFRQNDLQWRQSSDLDAFFQQEARVQMGFGTALTQYALVKDSRKDEQTFVWTIHHSLFDGWTVSQVFQRVHQRYAGLPLYPPLVGFNQYVRFLLQKDDASADKFWRMNLQGSLAPKFPSYPSSSFSACGKERVRHRFDTCAVLTAPTTIATIVQASFAMVLGHYEQSLDVIYGYSVSGRDESLDGIDRVVGPTMNAVPLRICLRPAATVYEFLKQVQSTALSMIPYQTHGLTKIASASAEARAACNIRTYLVIAPSDMIDTFEGLKRVTGNYQQAVLAPYPILIQCKIMPAAMTVWASFDEQLVSRVQMTQMLSKFERCVKSLSTALPSQMVHQTMRTADVVVGPESEDIPRHLSPARPRVKSEIITVGGSLSGLMASLVLLQDGHRVTVLERAAHPISYTI